MIKLKLSELQKDTVLSFENAHYTLTASELIHEITVLGEDHSKVQWYIAKAENWSPNAQGMVECYIESLYDNMYEDWDERAFDCFKEEDYQAIQGILDRVFKRDSGTTNYWSLHDEIEIDVFPVIV